METYTNGIVTVDDRFARFGEKSYIINQITSVEIRETTHVSSTGLLLGLFGTILLFFGLSLKTDTNPSTSQGIVFSGLIFIGLAWFLHSSRITQFYELIIVTSSGEYQAAKSKNLEQISKLKIEIENRITK